MGGGKTRGGQTGRQSAMVGRLQSAWRRASQNVCSSPPQVCRVTVGQRHHIHEGVHTRATTLFWGRTAGPASCVPATDPRADSVSVMWFFRELQSAVTRTTNAIEEKRKRQRDLEAAVKQWEETCAAMALAEREAAQRQQDLADSCPIYVGYCVQSFVALVTEAPVRYAYHSACCCTCLAFDMACAGKQPQVHACAEHHLATQHEYCHLIDLLCTNVRAPFTDEVPYFIYLADVRLRRPPPPEGWRSRGDGSSGDDDEGCCCCCGTSADRTRPVCECEESCDCNCMLDLAFLLNRELRSLLCIFSCASSLHPGRCCGPAPCWESMRERHARWSKEADEAMDARTAAFYAEFQEFRKDLIFQRTGGPAQRFRRARGPLVARRVAQGVNVGKVSGAVGEKIDGTAPVPQTMAAARQVV